MLDNEQRRYSPCPLCGKMRNEKFLVCSSCNEEYVAEATAVVASGGEQPDKKVWVLDRLGDRAKLERELEKARRNLARLQREFAKRLLSEPERFPQVAEAHRPLDELHTRALEALREELGGRAVSREVFSRLLASKMKEDGEAKKAREAFRKALAEARRAEAASIWKEIGGNEAFRAFKAAESRLRLHGELTQKLADQMAAAASAAAEIVEEPPASSAVVETATEVPEKPEPKRRPKKSGEKKRSRRPRKEPSEREAIDASLEDDLDEEA
jgi:hypothetical protein